MSLVLKDRTCRAAAMEKAYISRTQPSCFLAPSMSASMCAVSRSQSGVSCINLDRSALNVLRLESGQTQMLLGA